MPETYKGGQGSPPTPGYDCTYPPYTGTGPSDGPTDPPMARVADPFEVCGPPSGCPPGTCCGGGPSGGGPSGGGPGGSQPMSRF